MNKFDYKSHYLRNTQLLKRNTEALEEAMEVMYDILGDHNTGCICEICVKVKLFFSRWE